MVCLVAETFLEPRRERALHVLLPHYVGVLRCLDSEVFEGLLKYVTSAPPPHPHPPHTHTSFYRLGT